MVRNLRFALRSVVVGNAFMFAVSIPDIVLGWPPVGSERLRSARPGERAGREVLTRELRT